MGTKKGIAAVTAFLVLLSLSSVVWAVNCPIPDTGQTKCSDMYEEITCPQPGEDFYGQDAQYSCNPQSYTTLGGGIMVQDNVTGLIWEIKDSKDSTPDYGNPHDADNEYTWYDSNPATNGGNAGTPGDGTDTEDFINALNTAQFGGYDDWRMPTSKELSSITNSGTYIPSIDTAYFPNTVSSGYWSSTSVAGNPS